MNSKRGLQGMITSLAEKEELNAYMDTLSPGDRARINSASQKFASTWLQSTASNTKLDNQHFAKALQLRLVPPVSMTLTLQLHYPILPLPRSSKIDATIPSRKS